MHLHHSHLSEKRTSKLWFDNCQLLYKYHVIRMSTKLPSHSTQFSCTSLENIVANLCSVGLCWFCQNSCISPLPHWPHKILESQHLTTSGFFCRSSIHTSTASQSNKLFYTTSPSDFNVHPSQLTPRAPEDLARLTIPIRCGFAILMN